MGDDESDCERDPDLRRGGDPYRSVRRGRPGRSVRPASRRDPGGPGPHVRRRGGARRSPALAFRPEAARMEVRPREPRRAGCRAKDGPSSRRTFSSSSPSTSRGRGGLPRSPGPILAAARGDDGRSGQLAVGKLYRESVDFWVAVPDDPGLDKILFFHPYGPDRSSTSFLSGRSSFDEASPPAAALFLLSAACPRRGVRYDRPEQRAFLEPGRFRRPRRRLYGRRDGQIRRRRRGLRRGRLQSGAVQGICPLFQRPARGRRQQRIGGGQARLGDLQGHRPGL